MTWKGEGFGKVGRSGKVGEKKLRKKKIYYLYFGKSDEQKDTKNKIILFMCV
jgi:hypothetical protein